MCKTTRRLWAVRARVMAVAVAAPLAALGLLSPGAHAAGESPASGSASASGSAPAPSPVVTSRVYAFHAFLDDKPIGEHTFTVAADGPSIKVTSEADFAVKVLGIRAYHYHHHADEQWSEGCLAALAATTDDDGKPASVHMKRDGDTDTIKTAAGDTSESGCLMTYAYWNPALKTQTRLLNPQTGKVERVHVEAAGSGTITVGGKPVNAMRYRISSPDSPIDVWYSDNGQWIGLDSMVSNGKRKLSYRLP